MKRDTRRQADHPRSAQTKPKMTLESLETRELLSTDFNTDLIPSLLYRRVEPGYPPVEVAHPIGSSPVAVTQLDNDGKVIEGETRAGDEYVITVHGPGVAIVTDTSPNDGLLNDEIDTIQLVGTDLYRTYVTGQVESSDRVITDGTIGFNRLIATDGVASIVLNGFVLQETGPIPSGTPRIVLLGGVQTLAFHAIETVNDTTVDQPVDVIIGDPSTPLTVQPNIRIDHIFNTAFDGSTGLIAGVPQTDPTVRIQVNGQIQDLELISATAAPVPANINAIISPVAYTGRTSVQTFGVEGLKVVGSARNFTLSRTEQPFTGGFSGVDRLGHAYFGGRADAVALDATNGRIGRLKFLRGLGDPDGTRQTLLQAGIPLGDRGYPAAGLSGGVVAARSIGQTEFGPADRFFLVRPDPDDIQALGIGTSDYVTVPGAALTNATIATTGSIGDTTIVGNARNTLVASGFDYLAFRDGLDPVREPSQIGRWTQRGDLVDSVVAASYRPVDGIYGNENDLAGRGVIRGNLFGSLFLSDPGNVTGPATGAPRVRGVGFFAKRLIGHLPNVGFNPEPPKRVDSVLVRA